jgi:alpha-beta hydrolase superfamily lysophospholipase
MSDEFPLQTPDGLTLVGRRWPVDHARRHGRAVLIHGVGEHSARYDEAAGLMNALGIEVVSYDQRGFGKSPGDPGKIPDELTLVTDAVMVFDRIQKEAPSGPPPFLIAHSMGGTIAAFSVARGLIAPRALALSSPAIAPRVKPFEEQLLRGLVTFAPDFALDSRIMPDEVTRDVSEQKKIKHDKLMRRTVTPRLVLSIIDQGRAALAEAGKVRVPTLLLVAGADEVVDPNGTLRFFAGIPVNLATLHQYPSLFHEVFNELPADRKVVFADFERWLRRQLGQSAPPA